MAAAKGNESFIIDSRFSAKELRHLRDRFLVLTEGKPQLDRCVTIHIHSRP